MVADFRVDGMEGWQRFAAQPGPDQFRSVLYPAELQLGDSRYGFHLLGEVAHVAHD